VAQVVHSKNYELACRFEYPHYPQWERSFFMTFWAKLLTVVAFVLSLLFAAMSGTIYCARQEWRGKALAADAKLATAVAEHADTLAAEKQRFDKKNDEWAAASAKYTAKEQMLAAKESELKAKIKSLDDLQGKWDTLNANMLRHIDTIKTLNVRIEGLIKAEKKSDSIITKNIKTIASLNEERLNLRNQLAKLQSDHDDALVKLHAASQTLDRHEALFVVLTERNIEFRGILDSIVSTPMIRAKVLVANPELRVVALNVGKKHKVRKAQQFILYRGGRYVCDVIVTAVRETDCTARITRTNIPPQADDDAATRLPL
jgi:hypothetical protein